MFIDQINLNHLRIFECVYRAKSMTEAAKELHLTQSGVSQHMKALEDVLDLKLFDRVKQRLIPTRAATVLFKKCTEALYGIEEILGELKGGNQVLSGTVALGMPIEFGNNLVVPLLSDFCSRHPRVRFVLRYGFATEMNDGLLKGELDFAFVDAFNLDARITTEKVYDEILHLCCSPSTLEKIQKKASIKDGKKFFEALEYVDYQPGEPILRLWFNHHLGTRHVNVNVRATVMDAQGILRLIQTGGCAGVLPSHLVDKVHTVPGATTAKAKKALHIFKGADSPLKNGISVAYLKERTQSPASAAAYRFMMEGLAARRAT
jgi:DNA-binding transcriptional LysR family regulator